MDMSTNNGVYLSKSISVCLPDHLFNLLLKSLKKNKHEKYTKIILRPCICVKPVLRSINKKTVQTVCDLSDSEEKLQDQLHRNESALLVWKSYTCETRESEKQMTNSSTLQVTESLSDISLHSTLVDMFPNSHPQDIHMYNNIKVDVLPYYTRNAKGSSYNKSLVSETKEEEDVTANILLHSELNPIKKESILPEKPLPKTKSVLTQTSPACKSVYVQTDEESGKSFEVFTQAIAVQTDLKSLNDSSTQTVTQFNSLSTQTMIDLKSVSAQTIYELRPAAAETVSTQTEDGAVFFFENLSQQTEIKKIYDTEIIANETGVSKSSEVCPESSSTELSDLEDTLKDLGHPVSSKRVFLSLNNTPETMVELKRDNDFDSLFMKDSADKVIDVILTDAEEKIVVEPASPVESRIYKSEFFREHETTVPVTVTDQSKRTDINYSQPISVNTEFEIEEYHPVSKRDSENKPKEIPVEMKKTSFEIKKTHDFSKPEVQIGLEKITTHKDMKKPFHKSHNNGKEANRKLHPAETNRITKPVIRSKFDKLSMPRNIVRNTPAFKSRVLNTERGKEKYSTKPVVTQNVIKNVTKPKQQIISRPSKIKNVNQKSSKPLIAQGKTAPVKTKIGNITEFKAESKLTENKSYENHAAKHYATVTVSPSSKHNVTMKKSSQSSASHRLRMAADTTVMQESYQPVNYFKTKPVLYKPDKFHKKTDQPLDDTTIHKMSYVPHSRKEKKELTSTPKGTYKTAHEPMDDKTIYKECFIPPGKFESVNCANVCRCPQLNPCGYCPRLNPCEYKLH